MKKIVILIAYFGHWPEWFPFYLESCRWNPTIDWLFFTDCPIPENAPTNLRFIQINYVDYQKLVSNRLGITFTDQSPYKLCDLKPAYGYIHEEFIADYDYFGFGDIDVVYGDIRAFYTDKILRYNTLSTLNDMVSGHIFLMKNEERWIRAFQKIPNWQQLLLAPEYRSMDEYWFTKVLRGYVRFPSVLSNLWGIVDTYKRNHLFQERYATPLVERPWMDGTYNYPDKWYWYQGKLTNEFGGEFLYLHFMNWKSSKYLPKRFGERAAWEILSNLIDPTLTDISKGWCISSDGFIPLNDDFRDSQFRLLLNAKNQS
ncbi:DUF6625 family protein [Brunnivagina elsteri]|uniref:Uncharacterized protein n=1 Tax=Brunnivagina elsteri CCALA 953 TaxID=987040 RepID=A0A2A2TMS7_9CYAN|nr:DUF6625 family protein [Calothrix elsteri]PAX59725.1 hypothetical protein CK510_05695 [Calothrix elsteri CCALA 953]